MSQAKLGNALGITFQQVQKYEIGNNRVARRMSFTCFSADPCGPGFCLIFAPFKGYDEPKPSVSKTPQSVSRLLTGYI